MNKEKKSLTNCASVEAFLSLLYKQFIENLFLKHLIDFPFISLLVSTSSAALSSVRGLLLPIKK